MSGTLKRALAALLAGGAVKLTPMTEKLKLRGGEPPPALRVIYREPGPERRDAQPPNIPLPGRKPWER